MLLLPIVEERRPTANKIGSRVHVDIDHTRRNNEEPKKLLRSIWPCGSVLENFENDGSNYHPSLQLMPEVRAQYADMLRPRVFASHRCGHNRHSSQLDL